MGQRWPPASCTSRSCWSRLPPEPCLLGLLTLLCSCSSSTAERQAPSRLAGRPGPNTLQPVGPWALGRLQAGGTEPPNHSVSTCSGWLPCTAGWAEQRQGHGVGQGCHVTWVDRAHPEPWAGTRHQSQTAVAGALGLTSDVSSCHVQASLGSSDWEPPPGDKLREGGAEGAHRSST